MLRRPPEPASEHKLAIEKLVVKAGIIDLIAVLQRDVPGKWAEVGIDKLCTKASPQIFSVKGSQG